MNPNKWITISVRIVNRVRLEPLCEDLKFGTTKNIGYAVWQRNFYEHIIRDGNDHARIVDYIENNPMRWKTDELYKK